MANGGLLRVQPGSNPLGPLQGDRQTIGPRPNPYSYGGLSPFQPLIPFQPYSLGQPKTYQPQATPSLGAIFQQMYGQGAQGAPGQLPTDYYGGGAGPGIGPGSNGGNGVGGPAQGSNNGPGDTPSSADAGPGDGGGGGGGK